MGKLTQYALIGTLGMIGTITAMQSLGSNLEDEFEAQAMSEPNGDPFVEAAVEVEEPASHPAPVIQEASPQPPQSTNELDESDRVIALAINLSGNLCARPLEVHEADAGVFGVRCVTNRDGTGISDYLVNARTNEVIPI